MPNYYTPRFQDYMKSNDHISLILSQKDGFKLFTFYECLLCQSIPGNGIIELPNNQVIITPYLLATLLNRFTSEPDWVDCAVQVLLKFKIIEIQNDGRTIKLNHYITGRPDVHGINKPIETTTSEEHHELTLFLIDRKYFKTNMKNLKDADDFFTEFVPIEGFEMNDLKEILGKFVSQVQKSKEKIGNRVAYMKTSFWKAIKDKREASKKQAYSSTLEAYDEAGF